MDQNQQGQAPLNVNEDEIKLIQSVFNGNESLLKAMRAIAFGLDVSDEERQAVLTAMQDDALFAVVKRRVLPELDKETPIGQVQDAWLGTEGMVFGATPETQQQAIAYKAYSIELTEEFLNAIRDGVGSIDIDFDPAEAGEMSVTLLGRNNYIRHIESQLMFLWMIAEMRQETTEEKTIRKNKDSTQ